MRFPAHIQRSLALCLVTALGLLPALSIGDPAPSLQSVTLVKGEPIKALTGDQVSIVEFWATWCGPCLQSIPHLSELQRKHPEIQIIGLSDEDADTVKPFVETQGAGMAYRVGLIDEATRSQYMDNVPGIPHAFIVGKGGTVLWAGHPMEMDGVLASVLTGTFDIESAKNISQAEAKLQAAIQGRNPDLPAAKEAIAAILALDPVNNRALNISLAIAKHEEDEAGLRAILEAIPVDKLSAEAANGLAWERVTDEDLGSRHLDLALRFIDHALTLDPTEAALVDTRARILYSLGRLDLAIAEQERACALDPDATGLQRTLAHYRDIVATAATLGTPAAAAAPAPVVP